MFRTLAAAVVATFFMPVMPAAAAGNDAFALAAASAAAATADAERPAAASPTPLATDVDWSLPAVQIGASSRGSVLPTLYASLAALNAFDAYSTTKGLARGAVEANPLMKPVAGNPTALWAVKGGATAASILVAERLWKQNRKGQAIAVMVVTNGMMAVVAAKNARVLR